MGDSHNFLAFYISGSENVNIGCENIWFLEKNLPQQVTCRQARPSPLVEDMAAYSEYPESLPEQHSGLTRISATETEKWVLARLAAWACVSVHSGAFCSLARQSRQRGGRGAQGNVGQWASQFVLCAPRQQPAHILARAPARGFLHWIHYTLKRKSVFASILILVYGKKVIYMSAFILIHQF